ncbi:MAG: DUF2325 domain-containing protein [Firmicutes bacterium HGW-Firmicutes-16]|nr:MAG: DUF2325 domain-containing protein [Firmicutes bacterium HGW-Firmicutes-16]
MSIVIIGGNERMERIYSDTCEKYGCTAKVYTKEKGALRSKIGSPDLLIVFTNTVSHGMRECAETEARRCNAVIARSHSSSLSALTSIMEIHCRCRMEA